MAVKLLRCSGQWVKIKGHPCWRVEKALKDMGVEYEAVHLPTGRGKRDQIQSLTGQNRYPAIQFEDGSVYREESKDMERTIRAGKLMEKAGAGTAPQTSG
jgi:glutaredoxin